MRIGNNTHTNTTRPSTDSTRDTATNTSSTRRADASFQPNENRATADGTARPPQSELRRTVTGAGEGGAALPETTSAAPRLVSRGAGDAPSLRSLRSGVAIRRDQAGDSVAELQDRLTQLGHGVQQTGIYGPTTEGVVKDFQRAAGLATDGLFGKNSMAALRKLEMAPRPNHDAVQNGVESGRIFQQGDKGAAVVDVQRLLGNAGFATDVDGDFGPATAQAIKDFQAANNIVQNGLIGPTTLQALQQASQSGAGTTGATGTQTTGGAPTPPATSVNAAASTSGMTTQQKYDHFRGLVESHGGQFKTGPNQFNIVSLRNETDTDVNGGGGRYDDRTALVWTDSQGRPRVEEYRSNTEPSAQYRGRMGVDANGDGRLDQGRLAAGYYEYTTGHSSSLGRILIPTASAMAERDTNHDGLFNDGAFGSAGRSMLFHAGGYSNTGSAGCQTMAPNEYNHFWNQLNSAGNPGKIGYTLINL